MHAFISAIGEKNLQLHSFVQLIYEIAQLPIDHNSGGGAESAVG